MAAIFLLGFMGSGKSAVARHLARRLQLPLIDLDARIESQIGTTIANFFVSEGEEAFRRVETDTLEAVCGENAVVSLGGGVPTQEKNRDILKNAARSGAMVVYLQASIPVLAERIRRQPGKRPLIDGGGELTPEQTEARVRELLELRAPLYEAAASHTESTDTRGIAEIAESIAVTWEQTARQA